MNVNEITVWMIEHDKLNEEGESRKACDSGFLMFGAKWLKPHDFQGIWRSWGVFRSLTAIAICLQPLLPIPVALVGGRAAK